MELVDIYDYKNQLMKDLLTHENIVHLIDEDISMEDAPSLAYSHVYPYEYIPLVISDGATYVCFEVEVPSVNNKTTLNAMLYIWVFSHISRLRLNDGEGIRTDKLCSEICKVLNGSRNYGIGELELYSLKRYAPMSEYNGRLMTFSIIEWNRTYQDRKPAPANRKRP